MSFSAGVNFHGFGNFIIPLQNEFGWNRTQISIAFSLARLESGLFGPVEGWLVDRLGPRMLIFIGVPIMALGYVLFAQVNTFLHFVLVYVLLISLGNSIGMGMPMTTAVANWFNRKRGLAFGLMWSGIGLGGLFVPMLGWLVEQYEWRTAAVIVGVFVFALGTPIGLVMRHRPEPYGYMPDGAEPRRAAGGTGQARVSQPDLSADFSAREAMRTSSFWYLTLSIAARSLVSGGVGLHLVPYFEGLGASPVFAAALAGSAGRDEHTRTAGAGRAGRLREQALRHGGVAGADDRRDSDDGARQEHQRRDARLAGVCGGAGRHIRHTASVVRRVLRAAFLRHHTGLPQQHTDDGHNNWPHHIGVRVRSDEQLRVGVPRVLGGHNRIDGVGADGPPAQQGPFVNRALSGRGVGAVRELRVAGTWRRGGS